MLSPVEMNTLGELTIRMLLGDDDLWKKAPSEFRDLLVADMVQAIPELVTEEKRTSLRSAFEMVSIVVQLEALFSESEPEVEIGGAPS